VLCCVIIIIIVITLHYSLAFILFLYYIYITSVYMFCVVCIILCVVYTWMCGVLQNPTWKSLSMSHMDISQDVNTSSQCILSHGVILNLFCVILDNVRFVSKASYFVTGCSMNSVALAIDYHDLFMIFMLYSEK